MANACGVHGAKLIAVLAWAALIPAAASAQARLAPGVQKAPSFTPTGTAYAVSNGGPLFKVPMYDPDQETGASLSPGDHPQVLGQSDDGMWLLIGKAGTGVGYIERGVMCPATACKG